MNVPTTFDLLAVYTERLADSASSSSNVPFAQESSTCSYNVVYGYFLKMCERNNLSVAFTTSKDIVGAGRCSSYWIYKKNSWIKVKKPAKANLIFDKFSPINPEIKTKRKLLFSSQRVTPFNPKGLFKLFFDKHKTYKKLADYAIPTVCLEEKTDEGIQRACKKIARLIADHPDKTDFSTDFIIKDRFGAGGLNVFKINHQRPEKVLRAMEKVRGKTFIVQPFVNFDRGFNYLNCPVSADIRLIYLGGRIVQTYLRLAKKGDFRCNEHQGGRVLYIAKKDVPLAVTKLSQKIVKLLKQKRSLYALDFIISNNGHVYLLEGNTGPGLDWNLSLKKNELEAKKLIRIIVNELAARVEERKTDKQKAEKISSRIIDYPAVTPLPIVV